MTQKPSIATLLEARAIIRVEVDLAPREQPARLLFGTPGFVRWLEERINCGEGSPLLADSTPVEQLDNLFYTFISGRPLIYSRQFRAVRAEKNAVWELKTPDLRIFGWFMMRDCFVAVFGDWANHVKDHDLYRGYRIEIRRLRRELQVEGTLCVEGGEPGDVLSP